MKRNIIITILIISMIIISSVGYVVMTNDDDEADPISDAKTTLKIGTTIWADMELSQGDSSLWNIQMMFTHEGLVRYLTDGEIGPWVAKSWDTSDLQIWTFHINESATWQDGEALTSHDVAFTINYTKENGLNGGDWYYSGVDYVETPDDYTLVVYLLQPDYNFLTQLANEPLILPEHIYADIEDPYSYTDPDGFFMGSGPFEFVSYDADAGLIILEKNQDYWNTDMEPSIDRIEIYNYDTTDAVMLAFQKGDVDLPYQFDAGVSYAYVAQLLDNEDIGILFGYDPGVTSALWFDTNVAPFDNSSFRTAISYAIDYNELIDLFTGGYGRDVYAGFVDSANKYYVETRTLSQNISLAESLLDQLGYIDIDSDGIREDKGGEEMTLTILTRSTNTVELRTAKVIQDYLEAIGLDIDINAVDGNTFWTLLQDDRSGEMAIQGSRFWAMTDYENYFTGPVSADFYGWANDTDSEFKSLVTQLAATSNDTERQAVVAELQHYYAEEMPMIALYSTNVIQPYSTDFDGWVFGPTWGLLCYETFVNLSAVN